MNNRSLLLNSGMINKAGAKTPGRLLESTLVRDVYKRPLLTKGTTMSILLCVENHLYSGSPIKVLCVLVDNALSNRKGEDTIPEAYR